MHRVRHGGRSPLLRPRVMIALAVAAAGLTTALYLPSRNDTASATENRGGQSQCERRDRDDRQHCRRKHHRSPGPAPSSSPSSTEPPAWDQPTPSAPATTDPADPTPPPDLPPTTEPTTEPTPSAPPTTTAPPATTAPAWKPFVNYVAGALVTFEGKEYQVQQSHTSLPGWEPDVLPLLFEVLS